MPKGNVPITGKKKKTEQHTQVPCLKGENRWKIRPLRRRGSNSLPKGPERSDPVNPNRGRKKLLPKKELVAGGERGGETPDSVHRKEKKCQAITAPLTRREGKLYYSKRKGSGENAFNGEVNQIWLMFSGGEKKKKKKTPAGGKETQKKVPFLPSRAQAPTPTWGKKDFRLSEGMSRSKFRKKMQTDPFPKKLGNNLVFSQKKGGGPPSTMDPPPGGKGKRSVYTSGGGGEEGATRREGEKP